MAIPDGFKFSGVPRDVKTKDGGSALVKSKRGTYSFPDDFSPLTAPLNSRMDKIRVVSYVGALKDFGTSRQPFNALGAVGAIWTGAMYPPGSQVPLLVLPFDCTLKSVSFKWTENDSAAFVAATTSTIKVMTLNDLNDNPYQSANWTERLTLSTTLTDADDGFPGFLEEITDTTVYPAGTGITIAGAANNNVLPDTSDPTVIMTIQSV